MPLDTPPADSALPTQIASEPHNWLAGLSLRLTDGQPVLEGHKLHVGGWQVDCLRLGVPDVSFPCDVSGGADHFKNHRCQLQHLHVRASVTALNAMFAQIDWSAAGLIGVRDVHLRPDAQGLQLGGLYVSGEQFATFTCRVALLTAGAAEVRLIFYGVRLFGLWPVPGALLPMALAHALPGVAWAHSAPGVMSLKPGTALLREMMPRAGWRVPDTQHAALRTLHVCAAGLSMVLDASGSVKAGEEAAAPSPAALPPIAQAALSAMASFSEAEAALGRGDIDAAYGLYCDLARCAPGDPWVAQRLLTLGLDFAGWHAATQTLARGALTRPSLMVEAHLALANIALQRQDSAAAAQHFESLSDADVQGAWAALSPLDVAAAHLARASALRHIDAEGACVALGQAMVLAPQFGFGQAVLLALQRAAGAREAALIAGGHWLEHRMPAALRLQTHIEMGQLNLQAPKSLDAARQHFAAAIRLDAEAPDAWQGLADAAAAADEPHAVAEALQSLAGVWCAHGEKAAAAQALLEAAHWAIKAAAAPGQIEALFEAVLRLEPANSQAQLGLAEYLDTAGAQERACSLYDAVVAPCKARAAGAATAFIDAARLARAQRRRVQLDVHLGVGAAVARLSDAEKTALLHAAFLGAPNDAQTRRCLMAQLHQTGSHAALAKLLLDTPCPGGAAQKRQATIEACTLLLERCHDLQAARPLLETLLAADAHDEAAWKLFVPILQAQQDNAALVHWLEVRAHSAATDDRAACAYALAEALDQAPFERRYAAYKNVLDLAPGFEPAAQALVQLATAQGQAFEMAQAYGLLATALEQAGEPDNQTAQAAALVAQAQALYGAADADNLWLDQAQTAVARACQIVPQDRDAWALRLALAGADGQWAQARTHLAAAAPHLSAQDTFFLCMQLAELAWAKQQDDALAQALVQAHRQARGLDDVTCVRPLVRRFVRQCAPACCAPQLLHLLRATGLFQELSDALTRSLLQAPSCADGRFAELMRLWVDGPDERASLQDAQDGLRQALSVCAQMCQAFGQHDAPWHWRVRILLRAPDLGDVAATLAAWAELRDGRDKALILEALAAFLHGQNDVAAARQILLQACRVQPTDADNGPRLAQLAADYSAAQSFAQLADVLQMQAALTPPGAAQDAIWRRLADTAAEQLDDLPQAIAYLERLCAPTSSDLLWSAGMLMDVGAFAALADDPARLQILPDVQRLRLAQSLQTQGDAPRLERVLWPLLVHPRHARHAWSVLCPPEQARLQPDRVLALRQRHLARADLPASVRPWLYLLCAQERWIYLGQASAAAQLEPILRQVVWSQTDTAWAAFVVSRAAAPPGPWPARAARALCDCWPPDEPRLVAPLQLLLEAALAAADARLAVVLSRRLLALENPTSAKWLVETLNARVPPHEICQLLEERLDGAATQALRQQLVLQVVGLKMSMGCFEQAAALLDRQPQPAPQAGFAALAFAVGEALHDVPRQIQAARSGIDLAVEKGDQSAAQRWRLRLAQLHVATAPHAALALLQQLWEQDAAADVAFSQWVQLAAQLGDVQQLRGGLKRRLAQCDDRQAQLAAAHLVTSAWATVPGERRSATQALVATLGADMQPASVELVRQIYKEAADVGGLGAFFVHLAQAAPKASVAQQDAYVQAAHLADEQGHLHRAQDYRLAAVQASCGDLGLLDACLDYAQRAQVWPEQPAVYGKLMHRLAQQQPQAPEPVAFKIAGYAAEADNQATYTERRGALLAAPPASAAEVATAHVELALRAAACAQCAQASEHWLSALAAATPDVSWFAHAQRHCLQHGDADVRARLAQRAAAHLPLIEAQTHTAAPDMQPYWHALAAAAVAALPGGDKDSCARYQKLARMALPWPAWKACLADVQAVFCRAAAYEALGALYAALLAIAPDDSARAALYWALGCARRDGLDDHAAAQRAFAQACALDSAHGAASIDLGLSYVDSGDWPRAIETLAPVVDRLSSEAPRPALLGLLQAYQHHDVPAKALGTCDLLLAQPGAAGGSGAQVAIWQARADCLVALGRSQQAIAQWQDVLAGAQGAPSEAVRAGALCALIQLALAQGEQIQARAYFEEVARCEALDAPTLCALLQACQAAQAWGLLVRLRQRAAQRADSAEERAQQLLAAAQVAEFYLEDTATATELWEQACAATPRDVGRLHQLMDRYAQAGDISKKIFCAERLLTVSANDAFNADFFYDLAQSYADVDSVRAAKMAKQALELDPTHSERQALCRTLYAAAGDWQAYAQLEQTLVPGLTQANERGQRAATLAEVCIEQLGDLQQGLSALRLACQAQPKALNYWRRRAALLAQSADGYGEATECYRELLQAAPTDTTVLRILARLTGAQGDTDAAYGYYACLLCLLPEDDEAARFVLACRQSRRPASAAPQHVARAPGSSQIDAPCAPRLETRLPEHLVGVLQDVGQALHLAAQPAAPPSAHAIGLSLHHDIEESLAALMQMRGLAAQQSVSKGLIEAPGAARDLFVFAQSPDYFSLRAEMGAAIAAAPRARPHPAA